MVSSSFVHDKATGIKNPLPLQAKKGFVCVDSQSHSFRTRTDGRGINLDAATVWISGGSAIRVGLCVGIDGLVGSGGSICGRFAVFSSGLNIGRGRVAVFAVCRRRIIGSSCRAAVCVCYRFGLGGFVVAFCRLVHGDPAIKFVTGSGEDTRFVAVREGEYG